MGRAMRGLFGDPPTFDPPLRQYSLDTLSGDLFGKPSGTRMPQEKTCGGCKSAMPYRADKCDPDRLCGNEKRAISASRVPELRYQMVTIGTPACEHFVQRAPDEHDE